MNMVLGCEFEDLDGAFAVGGEEQRRMRLPAD